MCAREVFVQTYQEQKRVRYYNLRHIDWGTFNFAIPRDRIDNSAMKFWFLYDCVIIPVGTPSLSLLIHVLLIMFFLLSILCLNAIYSSSVLFFLHIVYVTCFSRYKNPSIKLCTPIAKLMNS